MNNVNLQLRSAYHQMLSGNITVAGQPVPMFYLNVTEGDPDLYLLLSSIQIGEAPGSKCSTMTDNSLVFTVYSRYEKNSGVEVDQVVSQLLEIIFPTVTTVVPGTLDISLISDVVTGGFNAAKNKQICERTITFQHLIDHQ